MRIGLSLTTIEPDICQGKIDGIGMYTKNLYETLSSRHAVAPYSFPNRKKNLTSGFTNGKWLDHTYSVATLRSLLLPFSLHPQLKNEIDIFHSTDHMIPKISSVPVVATIHDAIMFQHPEWHSMRWGKVKKMIRKRSFQWPDRYITISHAMVNELVTFGGLDPNKIDVVYHGIAEEWFGEASLEQKNDVREKYRLPPNFLLFASTLQEKKNLPRLVEAYLALPADLQANYPLIIVGRSGWGNEASQAAVDKIVSQNKGAWLNYVPYDDLRVIFQCADLYIHPSLHEGFGFTVLEAFASKTPVITSNVAALPEITGGAALLVDPLSSEEIKNGILKMLLNENMKADFVERGMERVKEFKWEKCAEETMKVYQKVL